jgi:hypothetical protein
MVLRSSRVLEILRETIEQAEQTPGLGPYDPGVVQLKQILMRWVAERDAAEGGQLSALSDQPQIDLTASPKQL